MPAPSGLGDWHIMVLLNENPKTILASGELCQGINPNTFVRAPPPLHLRNELQTVIVHVPTAGRAGQHHNH